MCCDYISSTEREESRTKIVNLDVDNEHIKNVSLVKKSFFLHGTLNEMWIIIKLRHKPRVSCPRAK